MIIHLVAAARPNFMKIAPLYHALKREKWAEVIIIHTGQHYDLNMSDAFFVDLKLPRPKVHLGVGSGSNAEQTGKVMMNYEKILCENRPDLIVVVGDVNSTMAATLAAVKLCLKVAHLEAGLRSFDRSMPEEINRVVTDALADILWTPSFDASENLAREGIPNEKISLVGNIMIDSLEMLKEVISNQAVYEELGLRQGSYGIVTLHRPSNVDDLRKLEEIMMKVIKLSKKIPMVFPIHPRTRKNLDQSGLISTLDRCSTLLSVDPLSYIRFMNLVFNCRLVITDSGGIQEETTYLGIPCLTMRSNTERPITISKGTNQLCSAEDLEKQVERILSRKKHNIGALEYWDGQTAKRVVKSIQERMI